MVTKLKFNVDELKGFSTRIEQISEDLSKVHTDTQNELKLLQEQWKTPAGEKFFNEQPLDWTSTVEKYISILNTLKSMIDYASEQYQEVQDLAEKVSIQ